MRVLAFLLALFILFLFSLALQAEIDFRYRRAEEKDHLEIDLRALRGILHTSLVIPSLQLEWEKGPQLEITEANTEEQAVPKRQRTKARLRYVRRGWIAKYWPKIPGYVSQFSKVKKKFYRGIHCKEINWRIEIGYKDPAQTAIAAGMFWSAFGFALSRLYKQVRVEVRQPEVIVVPQFEKEGFLCDLKCIFQVRIGHIIFVGFSLLRIYQRARRG